MPLPPWISRSSALLSGSRGGAPFRGVLCTAQPPGAALQPPLFGPGSPTLMARRRHESRPHLDLLSLIARRSATYTQKAHATRAAPSPVVPPWEGLVLHPVFGMSPVTGRELAPRSTAPCTPTPQPSIPQPSLPASNPVLQWEGEQALHLGNPLSSDVTPVLSLQWKWATPTSQTSNRM